MMNKGLTKGEIESAIRNAIIKFEQEFMGRGPDEVRAFVVRDLVVVRLKGVLTPAERRGYLPWREGQRLRKNLLDEPDGRPGK